jgi:hypothetical protein
MKFAYATSGNGRVQMRERQRRDRASTPELRNQFPQFSALRLTFAFRDNGPFTPAPQLAVLHPPAPAYFVFPCPYSDCSGEFDLSAAVNGMVHSQQDSCAGQLRCSGHRSFERSVRADCSLTLEYQVEAHRS